MAGNSKRYAQVSGGSSTDNKEEDEYISAAELFMNLAMYFDLFLMTTPFILMTINSPSQEGWAMKAALVLSVISISLQIFLFFLICSRYSRCLKFIKDCAKWTWKCGKEKNKPVYWITTLTIVIAVLHGIITGFVVMDMTGMDLSTNSTNQSVDAVSIETTTISP